jgi:predicted NUDIX family NTP pyrophosphohydrolase
MVKRSAGILMYRGVGSGLALLLAHPGGPFWAKKDVGAWSIPKGEYEPDEDPLACARREFAEELGSNPPDGDYLDLGAVTQPGRKAIVAFAVEGDFDPARLKSNLFELGWPPGSGRLQSFPEVDRAAWFAPDVARTKILSGQAPFIDRLLAQLGPRSRRPRSGCRAPEPFIRRFAAIAWHLVPSGQPWVAAMGRRTGGKSPKAGEVGAGLHFCATESWCLVRA